MSVLFFNNLGMVKLGNINTQASIQNQNKDTYEEKLAYGLALDGSVTLNGSKDLKVPKYSLITITGENNKRYRVEMNQRRYSVSKIKCFISIQLGYTNLILLRNCAYIKSNYSTYVEYFNSHLHQNMIK